MGTRDQSSLNLRETKIQQKNYVLSGRLADVPPKRSKVVRIFLSSTFTDTYTERNLLMTETYPHLKKICKEKYGLEFQVVDMRWGVKNEASNDHSAADLCMRELTSCQNLSVGPTFVALVSHRYGSRPIPIRIPEKELNLIMDALKRHGHEDEVLPIEEWFKLDENALPPEYILQPLNVIGQTHMTGEGAATGKSKLDLEVIYRKTLDEGRTRWRIAEKQLAVSLRRGANYCISEETLTRLEAHVFTRAVTDEEIDNGILRYDKRDSKTLTFIREIEDINLKHPKAWRFIDQNDDGSLDEEALDLLKELKEKRLAKNTTEENMFHFKVKWSDNEGINEVDHADYLKEFCSKFETEILRQIEHAVKSSTMITGDQLYDEVLEHAHQGLAKCERFHGRLEILRKMEAYIKSSNPKPLVIHGESGCGKTSLMAKAALSVPDCFDQSDDLHIVLRFMGTTPFTSTISSVLASVTEQLHRSVLGTEAETPQNFIDIKDMFNRTLDTIGNADHAHKKVILILDSIDQLSPLHGAHELGWLPMALPPNIRIIVSTLPEEHNILSKLKEIMPEQEQYVAVEELSHDDCRSILHLWLTQAGRKITEDQDELFKNVIEHKEVRPLYLKLIFDDIVTWRSYQKESELSEIKPNIESSILQLYDRLERKHGGKLVQRAFGYLTASLNGLTELEMEDLLSLDDDVLNTVFEFHLPPIRRLPSILWARIRADISEYIVDREADGARVMAWYHRQFIENAKRYFNIDSRGYRKDIKHPEVNGEDEADISLNMFHYFKGTWSGGTKKPFQYTQKQIDKYKFESPKGQENRYVTEQQSIFRASDGMVDLENINFNERKVNEFPNAVGHCLKKLTANKNKIQVDAVSTLVFDWEFLAAWVGCSTWADISDELENHETGGIPDSMKEEITLMRSAFLLCITALYNNPISLGVQIAGRMLPYYGNLENLTKLIAGIEGEGRCCSALVAPHYNMETPGGAMLFVINNHTEPVRASLMTGSGLISVSSKLVVVDMEQGSVVVDTRPRAMPANDSFGTLSVTYDISGSKSGSPTLVACASLRNNPSVFIMNCDDGQVRAIVDCNDHIPSCGKITKVVTVGSFLIVAFDISKDMAVINAFDGTFLGTISCTDSVRNIDIVLFNEKVYLMSIHKIHEKDGQSKSAAIETYLNFTLLGDGSVSGDDSDNDITLTLDVEQLGMEARWWQMDPVRVSLGTAQLTSYTVAPSFVFVAFAFDNGEITYLLTSPEDTDDDVGSTDQEDSDQEDYDSDDSDYGKVSGGIDMRQYLLNPKRASRMKMVPGLPARMKTVAVDYYPIHAITTLRASVIAELLLTVACTPHMLVVYEMTAGHSILKVRKHYDGAKISAKGNYLIASDGGEIDIYKMDIRIPGIQFAVSLDAHSRPIADLGVLGDEYMFYTSSDDASLKFWNMEKLDAAIPKFDHGKGVATRIRTDKVLPHENNLALTVYLKGESERWMNIWHVMSGEMLQAIRSPRSIGDAILVTTEVNGKLTTRIVAVVTGEEMLYWDITDLTDDSGTSMNPKRTAGKVPLTGPTLGCSSSDASDSPNVDIAFSVKANVIWAALGNDVAVLLKADTLEQLHSLNIARGGITSSIFVDEAGCFVGFNKTDNRVITYDPQGKTNSKASKLEKTTVISADAVVSRILTMSGEQEFSVFDTATGDLLLQKCILHKGEHLDLEQIQLTPDGCYVVCTSNRHVLLVRVSDGRLIANVTLYDNVMSLDVTADGWFALMGMPDKRLYILLISDPLVPEHEERVKKTRALNKGLDEEKSKELLELAKREDYDSSDDGNHNTLQMVRFIDMDQEGYGRSLSRNASSMARAASRSASRSHGGDAEADDEDDTQREKQTVVTPQLCNIQ